MMFSSNCEKETSLEGLPNRRKVVTLPGPETMQAELVATGPVRKRTQELQDEEDGETSRKVMKDLVASWMDRLQLISVITTFFASIEAGLLQITTPDSKGAILSRLDEAANAGLIGALVVHANAAIISFIGAFFLVRYELDEAKKEERNVKKHTVTEAPVSHSPDSERGIPFRKRTQEAPIKTDPVPGPVKINTVSSEPPIWSSNPHLVQVGPFRGQPPTHLLGRCHTLCIFLAFLGFVLALMGIVCFAWDRYPTSVSAFTTVCMGFCLIVGGAVLILPDFQTASST